MRKFKVLKCKQSRIVYDVKKAKTAEGAVRTYKVYREEQAGENGWWPGAYGYEKIKEGDILELEGHLADKAASNPMFEEVFDKPKVESPPKKKVGRPKKKVA